MRHEIDPTTGETKRQDAGAPVTTFDTELCRLAGHTVTRAEYLAGMSVIQVGELDDDELLTHYGQAGPDAEPEVIDLYDMAEAILNDE
jgi:hypothetical protein